MMATGRCSFKWCTKQHRQTSVYKQIDRYFTWQWENTASYTKAINGHNFSVLVGTSARKFNYEDLYGFNAKVPLTDPDNVYLNMAQDTVWVANGRSQAFIAFIQPLAV